VASVAQLQRGALFADRFRVERLLGRGGMGAVYEVTEEATGERWALKVLAPQLLGDAKHLDRFARETTFANRIDSDRVVKVVEAGLDAASETPWLTMELLHGESLQSFVRTHGRLDVARARVVMGQVGEALAAAHAAGVIHRDLKPDNVFVVREAGTNLDVKVLDFGIAKLASDAGTRSTGAMGSPLWMAPEEAQKAPITPATDVWTYGLLAYFVLTGRVLWRSGDGDANVAQALKEVLLEPLPDPNERARAHGVTLPRGFAEWASGCVVREPGLRFQNATDAARALDDVFARALRSDDDVPTARLVRDPAASTGSLPALAPSPPSPSPPSRHLTLSWLVGVLGVALATGFMIAAGTMIGRALQSEDAPPAPSDRPPPPPSAVVVDVPIAPPTVSATGAPVDAGDPVLAAVEACFDRADLACARTALEPAVFGKHGTAYEAQLLYDLCEVQRDAGCQKTVAKLHPKVDRAPGRKRTLVVPPSEEAPDLDASVWDQAFPLSVSDPARARAILEPRVYAGRATANEVGLLHTICTLQKDAECTRVIDKRYPQYAGH
jgi:serine/threonine protein kinase